MNLQLRFTQKQDYTELCQWWGFWGWEKSKPSLDLLDNLKYGLMVSENGVNICSGFIYVTNAKKFGLLEYIVSNPNVKNRDLRKSALIHLIECLKQLAAKYGIETLISYLLNDSLINKYLECGFVIGDKNATAMICKL